MLRVIALYLTTFHSLIKHLSEEDSLFICCPPLFISTRPPSSSSPPARQTILPGLPQRFAFLLSTNFLLHNAPTQRLYCTRPPAEADLISRGQTERVKEGAERRTTHRFYFTLICYLRRRWFKSQSFPQLLLNSTFICC